MRVIPSCILTLLLMATAGCSPLFFHPSRQMQEHPALKVYPPEEVFFRSGDGTGLHGWYFRAEEPKGTVLVLHGNAQNISNHIGSVLWLVPSGFNLFIFDYRGYGRSDGQPDLDGVHRDADAALGMLLDLPGVDRDRIAVLGQSLGGSIAAYTVARSSHREHVRALVIDSAFASYRRIAREKMNDIWLTWPFQYPASLLFNDKYSAEKFIGQVSPVPVLILHGTDDPVVPTHHGQRLFDTARDPKQIWLTARPGHIQSFGDDGVRDQTAAFLRTVLAGTESRSKAQ